MRFRTRKEIKKPSNGFFTTAVSDFKNFFHRIWSGPKIGDRLSRFGVIYKTISAHQKSKNATYEQIKTADFYSAFAVASSQDSSKKRIDTLQKLLGTESDGWELYNGSTEKTQVFFNNKTKQVVTSFKGTNPSDPKDLISDLALATGFQKYNPRFKESAEFMKKLQVVFKGYDIILASHSLGGTIDNYVNSEVTGIKHVYNFNPGAGIPLRYSNDSTNTNTTDFFVVGDPISVLGYGNPAHEQVYLPHTEGFPHSLSQFDVVPPTGTKEFIEYEKNNTAIY